MTSPPLKVSPLVTGVRARGSRQPPRRSPPAGRIGVTARAGSRTSRQAEEEPLTDAEGEPPTDQVPSGVGMRDDLGGATGQFGAVVGPDALAPVAVAAGLGREQVKQGPAVSGVVAGNPTAQDS